MRSAVLDAIGGKAAELPIQALLVLVIPGIMGPVDYGTFALAVAMVTLGSASLALGGPSLMSRFVPAALPEERAAVARTLAVRVARWRALAWLGVAAAATVLAALYPEQLPADLTALVVIALALDVAATLAFQVALGLARTRIWSYRYAFQNSLLVVAALVGYGAAGVDGACVGIVIASAGALVWGLAAIGRRLYEAPTKASMPPGAMRFGTWQALANLFIQFTHRAGIVAVAVLAGSKVETGFAAIALGISLAATYAVWQMFAVLLPVLLERWSGEPERVKAEATLRRLAGWSLAVVVPAALIGVLAVGELVPLVFGDEFAGAEPALALALASLPLAPLTGLSGQTASVRLRAGTRAVTAGAGAIAFVLTAAVAVPAWDAAGASAAFCCSAAVTVIASHIAMPGSVGGRVLVAGLAGSGAVTALAVLTTSL